jgi:hypothetical protein
MKILVFIINFILLTIKSYYIKPGLHSNITLANFSFGSCYRGFLSDRYDIFKIINQNNPNLWVWLGDAAYVHELHINVYKTNLFDENFAKDIYQLVLNDECKLFYINSLNIII